jgi:predicted secreted protein
MTQFTRVWAVTTVVAAGCVCGIGWRCTQAQTASVENVSSESIKDLKTQLHKMTRAATQFHKELEACQQSKGFEWRERMQAICSGYVTDMAP